MVSGSVLTLLDQGESFVAEALEVVLHKDVNALFLWAELLGLLHYLEFLCVHH
jgi:hypothetical protein